jgi:tRNA-2-methylthio-N6-dimethylallyladenosine synthase
MKRKVTVVEYMQRIEWLREAVPGIAISTDLIVGFPGETEEEFAATLQLVEAVRYSFIYSFKYSSRKGTAAARFVDQVSEDVKDERLARLNQLQDKITLELALADVGTVKEVLFAYNSKKYPEIWIGKTPEYRVVRVKSAVNLAGRTLPVRITNGSKTALEGELLN